MFVLQDLINKFIMVWIINKKKVKVILDESQYGKTRLEYGEGFNFYYYRDGKFESICTQKHEVLIAVTKDQYNARKNSTIISVQVFIDRDDHPEQLQLF